MTLVTSPAWSEKPLLIATAKPPTVFEPHTVTLQDGPGTNDEQRASEFAFRRLW